VRALAVSELVQMELAGPEDVLDLTVRRMEKTYPAYFGTYGEFGKIREYTDRFSNLFLIGRNGMHKYNNTDHSMLTAMVSVDNIVAGVTSKENIWAVNTEQEYHEEKKMQEQPPATAGDWMGDYFRVIKKHQKYLFPAAFFFLLGFFIFKSRYPFANYMPDSYGYLNAAYTNADVNTWPVAYSKFLRLLSVFTHSDKILVGLQYFLMQAASYVFLFTLNRFFRLGKWTKNILFTIVLLNPVPLYVANYVSADAMFYSVSLLWMASLVRILYEPKRSLLLAQGLLLLCCFTLRYNAMYYPLLTVFVFVVSKQRWMVRLAGIGISLIFIAGSIVYTSQKMQEASGKTQFSAFGGWQLANNALYMYETIPPEERITVPGRFAGLDRMVRNHFDTLHRVTKTREDSAANIFYLWSDKGPLVHYMTAEWEKDSLGSPFRHWASEGPLYQAYGAFLIKSYPAAFVRNFLWPNAVKYALPPPEFLSVYNMGSDSVAKAAKDWFGYKSQKIKEHAAPGKTNKITRYYSFFSMLSNLLLIIGVTGILLFTGFKDESRGLLPLIGLVVLFWMLNTVFSICASPIVLRYQVFPVFVCFCTGLLAWDRIYAWGKRQEFIHKTAVS